MLTIQGNPYRFCDNIPRRSFLTIGGMALGGLSLPEILRAEAQSGTGASSKGIIMIFLPGGPPHQDMFDLKPAAPAEIRGEFSPIKTNVPGIEICELMPRTASMMDKFAIIRSLVGAAGPHYAFQCLTGRDHRNQPSGGWPALGSVMSELRGPIHPGMPPFVGLSPPMKFSSWADAGPPGFLGVAHAPFKPNGEGKADMVLDGISLDRLHDRQRLLTSFDRFRRNVDASGIMKGLDAIHQQAFGVLSSTRLAQALDLSQEDPRVVERYGKGDPGLMSDGGPRLMEHFLMARRLIEAGTRCVTLAFSRWDWHGGNFKRGRQDMPMLDQGITALVEDLHDRGLDKDVTVIVWGEFGRTPKINDKAGRDHWRSVSCALLACGGLRTGQVVGSTDQHAAEPKDRPVHFQDVFATLYNRLGIDSAAVTVKDLTGRPHYLVDSPYGPIQELI